MALELSVDQTKWLLMKGVCKKNLVSNFYSSNCHLIEGLATTFNCAYDSDPQKEIFLLGLLEAQAEARLYN